VFTDKVPAILFAFASPKLQLLTLSYRKAQVGFLKHFVNPCQPADVMPELQLRLRLFSVLLFSTESPIIEMPSSSKLFPGSVRLSSEHMGLHIMPEKMHQPVEVTFRPWISNT
jgi:hypothetical protein